MVAAVQVGVLIAAGVFGGRPACCPQLTERRDRGVQVGIGHDLVTREGDSPIAVVRVRIEIPPARAETSAHVRSSSAWSSRHAHRGAAPVPAAPAGPMRSAR